MANPFLLLAGIGMMLAGLLPPLYWWKTRKVGWRIFAWGGVLWALAIIIKLLLDFTLTPGLQVMLQGLYPVFGVAVLTGVYVGLRTGLLESGFSYLGILRTKLKNMKWDQAVAFGLGFGCTEAFILGLFGFLNLLVLFVFPEALQALPESTRAIVMQQLELPTLAIFPAIMERVFVVLVHLFASLLVVYSVITRRFRFFLYSLAYKTIVDGIIPLLLLYVGAGTIMGMYLIELPIIFLGLVGLVGALWMRQKFKKPGRAKPNPRRDIAVLVAVCLAICLIGLLFAGLGVSEPSQGRVLELEGLEGRYEFIANGKHIGYSEYRITGKTTYKGQEAWHMNESANISSGGLDLYITGSIYLTERAEPLYYETAMTLNNDNNLVRVEFSSDNIKETIETGNTSQEFDIAPLKNTFLVSNNMIGQWALMFKSLKLEEGGTYTVNVFNPNTARSIVGTLNAGGRESITVQGREYQALVVTGYGAGKYYVSPEGLLLKIESPGLEIVLGG